MNLQLLSATCIVYALLLGCVRSSDAASISILGEQDFADGTVVASNNAWLDAQSNELAPFHDISVTPGPIEFTHGGLDTSSGRPGVLYFSLWDLDSSSAGSQVTAFLLDGEPQSISAFEVNETDSSVRLSQFPVAANLLNDGQLTVTISIGELPAANEVGIDFAALSLIESCPDGDADGVADATDECSATPASTAVDAVACSLSQFCALG